MPRKPRASSSSTPAQVDTPRVPTPDRLEVKVRRSTRQVAAKNGDKDTRSPDSKRRHLKEKAPKTERRVQGEGVGLLGPKEHLSSGSESKEEVEHDESMARQGVQEAIAGLAQMERRLVRATKRQKAKVKQSDLDVVRPDTKQEAAFKPSRSTTAPKALNHPGASSGNSSRDQLPTPDRDSVASDPDDSTFEGGEDAADGAGPGRLGADRPPPVNSEYLPLPWSGRLGYACLNTYLRNSNPTVFSSRTCRMSSIIDHRYPLQDPSQPEHPTKNRPDKTKKPDRRLGQMFVENLGLANARDIPKMLRWNDKYGIKFMRLSSEMFPFASHPEHGYKLASFASGALAEAGKVAAQLGHRLTMHPGQFTQLGSPRKEVITASVRDLEYHDELLSLLRLPKQQDRDAVMILHMGGAFGDKAATLDRFRKNYTSLLSPSIKNRLVLENDDVSWSVHDLLPICEELNIPLVLDFHHHNIVFDSTQLREGTYDISQPDMMERITATWKRKGIKQKMHYSEPCAGAVTPRDRRKHSPRVATLPPCYPDADLMIEAKDKEQAVFELMRTFKLPGYERIHDVIPHVREDENRPQPKPKKKAGTKKRKQAGADPEDEGTADAPAEDVETKAEIPAEELAMGGPENRVYWPLGMEEWLKPKKRVSKKTVAGLD